MLASFHVRIVRPNKWGSGVLIATLAGLWGGTEVSALAPAGRLVVLGFDGADARLVEALIEQGDLPNLAALAAAGSYQPLTPSNPPQTAVAWSSIITGLNPGRTGIMEAVNRQPDAYWPEAALNRADREAYRIVGFRSQAFSLGLGTALGVLLGTVVAIMRKLRRRRPAQSLRHGAGALVALGVFVVGMLGGIAGSSCASRYLPRERPHWVNLRHGTSIWETVAANGIRARLVRVPGSFPAPAIDGITTISGLGAPDMRGGGEPMPTLYTTDPSFEEGVSPSSVRVVKLQSADADTQLFGPPNDFFFDPERRHIMREEGVPEQIDLPLSIRVVGSEGSRDATGAGSAEIELPDGDTLELAVGEWSEWQVFTFRFNPLIRQRGIARFYLERTQPLTLYLSPIYYHPEEGGAVGFAAPTDLGDRVTGRFGLFKTAGRAIETGALADGLLDKAYFLEDVEETVAQQRRMMSGWLADDDWDVYLQVYSFVDRVSHLMWRRADMEDPEQEPAPDPAQGDAIRQAYMTMDKIVGEAHAALEPGDRLLVISIHGFAAWQRSLNVNAWLLEHGYLVGRGAEFTNAYPFANIDWLQSRAYALGRGAVYLNLVGREQQGVVRPGDESAELIDEIAAALETWIDPETGMTPVHRVYRRGEIYRLYDPLQAPELRVATNPPYQVGRADLSGHVASGVVTLNAANWSADHASSEPTAVPGVLFSSVSGLREGAEPVDLAPTILDLLGVPLPGDLDGHSLLEASAR